MQALEQWLSVATRGLCESAADRVRAEIGEHYLSALEASGTTDVDPLDAERRAVAALGDAKARTGNTGACSSPKVRTISCAGRRRRRAEYGSASARC
jgi:hypothetical protein